MQHVGGGGRRVGFCVMCVLIIVDRCGLRYQCIAESIYGICKYSNV